MLDIFGAGMVIGVISGALLGWSLIPCPLCWVRKKMEKELKATRSGI